MHVGFKMILTFISAEQDPDPMGPFNVLSPVSADCRSSISPPICISLESRQQNAILENSTI